MCEWHLQTFEQNFPIEYSCKSENILQHRHQQINQTKTKTITKTKHKVLMLSSRNISKHECNRRRKQLVGWLVGALCKEKKWKQMKRAKRICPLRHINRTQFYRCATCFTRALIIIAFIWNIDDVFMCMCSACTQISIDLKSTPNQSFWQLWQLLHAKRLQLESYHSWHIFSEFWVNEKRGKKATPDKKKKKFSITIMTRIPFRMVQHSLKFLYKKRNKFAKYVLVFFQFVPLFLLYLYLYLLLQFVISILISISLRLWQFIR